MATQGVSKAIGAISRVFGGGARAAAPVSRAAAPRAAARAAPRASQAARVRPASIRYGANALRYTGRTGFSSRQHLTNIRTKAWEFERRRRLQAKALQRLLNKRATTIQKVQRGNLSRSRVQALLQQRAYANYYLANSAASKIQNAWRGHPARVLRQLFASTSARNIAPAYYRSGNSLVSYVPRPGTYPRFNPNYARSTFKRPARFRPRSGVKYKDLPGFKEALHTLRQREVALKLQRAYRARRAARARQSSYPPADLPTYVPGYVRPGRPSFTSQAAKASRIEKYGVPAATAASLGGAVGTAIYGGPLVPWGPDNDTFQALQNIRIPDVLQEYGTEKARDLREWYRNREKSQKTRKQQPRKQQPEKKKENKQEKKRDEAARTIQRAYRAYVSRKRPSRLLLDFNDYERKRRRLY